MWLVGAERPTMGTDCAAPAEPVKRPAVRAVRWVLSRLKHKMIPWFVVWMWSIVPMTMAVMGLTVIEHWRWRGCARSQVSKGLIVTPQKGIDQGHQLPTDPTDDPFPAGDIRATAHRRCICVALSADRCSPIPYPYESPPRRRDRGFALRGDFHLVSACAIQG